jgi:hypothetical protein
MSRAPCSPLVPGNGSLAPERSPGSVRLRYSTGRQLRLRQAELQRFVIVLDHRAERLGATVARACGGAIPNGGTDATPLTPAAHPTPEHCLARLSPGMLWWFTHETARSLTITICH